ncbi:MAG: tRNA epoxyqueuosine(34) reductase QueG [Cytophagales bacterium]|nr:tRNA epoxyqueuosine(34) reductase QueG [Bernardetiaceae bacterium]MDW8211744.1 tRNA epoxyqueuosine(34) reductase QueG [Cytophagales bacterium]
MDLRRAKHTQIVKQKAAELGFDFCGISQAEFLEEEAPRLERWLHQGMHGKMSYMENHFDKRLDPRLLVPGAKSVISLLYNYYPSKTILYRDEDLKISKYAYGQDYHFVIKEKLKLLLHQLQEEIGAIEARVFVDSAPVMEKAWAVRSGLGWLGKHTNVINRQMGSFFFLAEIISDLDLEPDGPIKDYCGTCTRCIEACPTEAIVEPYVVDASRCISYLTIELKENIPEEFAGKMENWIFGCDICQDVCPWNRFAKPHKEPAFAPDPQLENMKKSDWIELTEEVFGQLFKKSAVKRAKFAGLKRNIAFATLTPASVQESISQINAESY